jgi:hypothetical protein
VLEILLNNIFELCQVVVTQELEAIINANIDLIKFVQVHVVLQTSLPQQRQVNLAV